MHLQELSDQFDILYNSITSNQAPGLNEWEKSVFLTKAEKQLVREYFNQRTDAVGGGFDGSQKRQYDFSCLLRTESLYNINTYADRIDDTEKLDNRSLVYLFPENYFLAVNEILSDDRWQYSVMPLDYAEYQRLMLKPYNLPVKRGAWRMITDKKNCNYWREYVDIEDEYGDSINSKTDYVFFSSWADQKRSLRVTITTVKNSELPLGTSIPYPSFNPKQESDIPMYFTFGTVRCRLSATSGWDSDGMIYNCALNLEATESLDDEEVIKALQQAFSDLDTLIDVKTSYHTLAKVCRHTDGFLMCDAPSHQKRFANGYTFETEVTAVPMVEIIGKFKGDVQYKLRYVRTLKPIILEDLHNYGDDLTIDGYHEAMECELPAETHEEILERAVTLAKIAWQGGTMTQAQAASQQRNRE